MKNNILDKIKDYKISEISRVTKMMLNLDDEALEVNPNFDANLSRESVLEEMLNALKRN